MEIQLDLWTEIKPVEQSSNECLSLTESLTSLYLYFCYAVMMFVLMKCVYCQARSDTSYHFLLPFLPPGTLAAGNIKKQEEPLCRAVFQI